MVLKFDEFLTPKDWKARMLATCPRMREEDVTVIEGGSHWITLEEPAKVLDALQRFLASLDAV